MLQQLAETIQNSALSQTMVNTLWVVPVVQSVHILAVAVVAASTGMLNLRLMQLVDHALTLEQTIQRFLPWIWSGLAVLLATGCLMIVAEPQRELLNYIFWIKMGLIFLAAFPLTLVLRVTLQRDTQFWSAVPGRRTVARCIGAVSLVLWVGAIFAGRWIAYGGGFGE